jgi:acetyl esterase/lipase
MFNEPNGWTGMTEADWLERYRICSDAIQSAVVDMNSRYGKSLAPQVFAPNTANGAEKYNTTGDDEATTDTWGAAAIANRHLQLDGTTSPAWMNLHVYNYQKYTTRQIAADGLSGFVTDYDTLRGLIDTDMPGEPSLPIALTEFNVRTGASYDLTTATQDSPLDFTALGANCIALSARGANQLYLFKFGQTANSSAFYGIAKNGTHYVENPSSGNNNYGGATQCAEVYKLFAKAAKGARPLHGITASTGASPGVNTGLWSMATRDSATDSWYVFLANRNTSAIPLEVDFSQIPVPSGNAVLVEEVSGRSSGGIVRMTSLSAGKLAETDMPAESVWLITLPGKAVKTSTQTAVADTQLGDGTSKSLSGGSLTNMEVRADGTINGRKVCLVRIPIPENGSPNIHSIVLTVNAATSSGTDPVRAHVYGVVDNSWQESSATWANTTSVLKQNIGAGNIILNNVVAGQGGGTQMLGQIVVDSPTASARSLDVTDFAKSRSDGFASFLIVQDHRWDIAQPALTTGDTQPAGLLIESRESSTAPRLVALSLDAPPSISSEPQSQTVPTGQTALFQVTAWGSEPLTYQWTKNGLPIAGADSSIHTIPSAGTSNIGTYQVIITNAFGSVTSSSAPLKVTSTLNVAREAIIRGGTNADTDQNEAAITYMLVRNTSTTNNRRKSYFQFDLPVSGVDLDTAATFTVRFFDNSRHSVQLWGLDQPYAGFSSSITWNNAQANETASNDMLTSGLLTATGIGPAVDINPGVSLTPHTFTIPRIGDLVQANRITLVLTGIDAATNSTNGLRMTLGASTLSYAMTANTAPSISEIADQTLVAGWTTGALPFTIADAETAASSLSVTAVSSNPLLVPPSNILLQGSGAGRTVTITPAAGESGTSTITIAVSDGVQTTSGTFLITVTPFVPATPFEFLIPRFSAVTTTSGVLFHSTTNYKGVATDLLADIYRPTGDTATNRPVVMLIHGGGFRTTGVRTQSYIVNFANEFAKRGFVAISIDYRQRSGADMPTSEDELPALKDAAADALIALQWIRANGQTYGYDPSSIFVAGGSAGGRIAAVLGCRETGDLGGLPSTDPFSTTSPASSITSDASAVYDRTGLIASAILWGGPEPEFRCYALDSGDLPSVMIHGTYDSTLQTSGSVDLYRALMNVGVPAGLYLLDGYEHSLATTAQASVNAMSQSAIWMAEYFVQEWQRKLSVSPVPPSILTVPKVSGSNLSLPAPFASSYSVAVQWRRNGVVLPGQTNPTLSLSGLTSADSGLYDVVISNPLGSWSSNVLSSLDFSNADLTSVTYDNAANSYTHPIELRVSAANVTVTGGGVEPAPPAANNDTATTAFNTPLTIQVLSNDSDPNGDALSITSVTQGANGAVVINGGTTVTYTPNANFAGADSFTYTISDGNGGVDTATVNITVNPAITKASVTVSREATVSSGTPDADVDEVTAGYIMIKYHAPLTATRKAYFQFDVAGLSVDASGSATFTIGFTNSYRQRVQLWALNQSYSSFSSSVTWSGAQANETTSNSMLISGPQTATPLGASTLIPLSGTTPVDFTIPNIGNHIHDDRITLVLAGESDALNNTAGLRGSRNSATLSVPLAPVPPWTTWRQAKFGLEAANDAISGTMADPDDDGINNLMEYALGGNPMTAKTGILPTIQKANNQVQFTFARNPSNTDLRLTVQVTENLAGPWTDAAMSVAGAAFTALLAGVTVSETDSASLNNVTFGEALIPELQHRFLRLRVEMIVP